MKEVALDKVVVHPLVLLSVTDHFTRVGKTGSGRVVGILLGKGTMGGKEGTLNIGGHAIRIRVQNC